METSKTSYKRFFNLGAWCMIITGIAHLIGHFIPPDLDSPEKNQLFELMSSIEFQFDPWFNKTVLNLFDCFSLALSVLIITLGLTNLIIGGQPISKNALKTLSLINFIGMIILLALSIIYAFSVPIFFFSLCAIMMFISFFKL